MNCPKKVLIFGGTHGNEWTGVMSVLHYADKLRQQFPELDLHFILANPEAYKINRRFKDEDLNRAFQFLQEHRAHSYEHNRARELQQLIQQEACFVIDLHTTTAQMGRTVIISHYHPVNLGLAAGLTHQFADCKVIGSPDPERKYLASQSDFSMMIEVGPVANGVIDAKALEGSIELLAGILNQIQAGSWQQHQELELYEEIEDVSYPQDERGQQSAYIHQQFQFQDFVPVSGQYLPFKAFSGADIPAVTNRPLYPIFINEAAYYPQQLAYTLCEKKMIALK
jgi:succinylglutamate desuccinylase